MKALSKSLIILLLLSPTYLFPQIQIRPSPDFMFLLALYADDDIKSAGMGKPVFAELLTNKYTTMEKWIQGKPYWKMSKNTAYSRTVLLTIDKLFGIRDLNETTVRPLSEKLKNRFVDTKSAR